MKVVINVCYGGFRVSESGLELLKKNAPYMFDEDGDMTDEYYADDYAQLRIDRVFINLVENHRAEVEGEQSHLKVVNLPRETTDYRIEEDDGFETLLYVVGGKIYEI